MRLPVLVLVLLLAGCIQPTLTRIDARTFEIQSGGIPGGSDAPNRRVAAQVCPSGYRVMNETVHHNTPDRYRDEPGVFTTWTIRCL